MSTNAISTFLLLHRSVYIAVRTIKEPVFGEKKMIFVSKLLVVSLVAICPLVAETRPVASAGIGAAVGLSYDDTGVSASFTVAGPIQVPGKTLPAGVYSIRIVDHLSDRMILRVDRKGKTQATFLALPKSTLASTTSRGPITVGSASQSAMRGFAFPDGTVAEFVYPKGEAVAIAKANDTTIPAIDPASEGRNESGDLSKDDMQMVTLWMLTPKQVGPGDSSAGITAAKYQAPPETASSQIPPRPKAKPKPIMTALPHTAGEMPYVLLSGLLALCGAGALTVRRRLGPGQDL